MLTTLTPVNQLRKAKWSRPFCFYNKDQIFDIKKVIFLILVRKKE